MEKIRRFLINLANWQFFALTVLVLASLVLHIAVITNPQETIFDEAHYVIDGRRILNGEGTERVEHPPLGKLFIVGGMKLFGDNPWGWRTPALLVSTIGLILFYNICRRLGASHQVAFLATFLLTFENLSFLHAGMAMLDEFTAFFTILAFWLYLRGLEKKSDLFNAWWLFMAAAVAMSALSKLSGALTVIPIGLHWLLVGYKKPLPIKAEMPESPGTPPAEEQAQPPAETIGEAVPAVEVPPVYIEQHVLERKGFFTRLGKFIFGYVYSLPFVFYALLVPVFFLGLMTVFDWIIWQRWINPIDQIMNMSSLTNSIKFTGYTAPLPSRPWEWLLSPTNSFSLYQWIFSGGQVQIQLLGYDWPPYGPHMTGMLSPSIFFINLLSIPYIIWRSLKRDNPALFALCWFIGIWSIWIPLSIITDRVSFSFYYLPAIPALCLGAALLISRFFDLAEGQHRKKFRGFIRGAIAFFLFFHLVIFCLLGPDKLSISIPASILILAFTMDYLGYSWQTMASAVIAVTAGVLGLRYILYRYLEIWFGTETIIGLYPANIWTWVVGVVVTLAVIGIVFFILRRFVLKKKQVAEIPASV